MNSLDPRSRLHYTKGRKLIPSNATPQDYGWLMVEIGNYLEGVKAKVPINPKTQEVLPQFKLMMLLAYKEVFHNFVHPSVRGDKTAVQLVEENEELKSFRSIGD